MERNRCERKTASSNNQKDRTKGNRELEILSVARARQA
jgi:hypothetical protein